VAVRQKNANNFKILAVDTATQACSAALADRDGTIAELNFFRGRTHSQHLAVMVEALLDMAETPIGAVNAFAVDSGPGTFTGLRIGLALVKGLAEAIGKPVVGVSSLEVLAVQAGFPPGQICCMLDARRGEVYTARYAVRDRQRELISAQEAVAPHRVARAGSGPCLFIGSGALAYRDLILETAGPDAWFAVGEANQLRASTVALLGLQQLQSGAPADDGALVPNYIRRSDAEYNKLR